MKAKRHHQISTHLAASLVVRADVQIARQTSRLQSGARATSDSTEALSLPAATVISHWLFECSIAPPPPQTKTSASAAQPARLPTHDIVQHAVRSPRLTRLRSNPWVMNMVWPVKRSGPAKITRVRATPKVAPMTI